MRNIIGQPVAGNDLYGREYELDRLWEQLEQGENRPDARAREGGPPRGVSVESPARLVAETPRPGDNR